MPVYTLNPRVFWPLLSGLCTALLCLCHSWAPLLQGSAPLVLLLVLLGLALLGCRPSPGAGGPAGGRRARTACGVARRSLLETFYERQLRLSPHVLGHSKAHVSRIVGELVRAAKAQGLALALRGDFVQIGSAYERHKVRSPDGFDILVPLRLPPRLRLEPVCLGTAEPAVGPELRGAYVCALRAPPGAAWPRGLCVELRGRRCLSSALVLRWFQGHVQRCLPALRYRLQERCRIGLAACPGRPLTLHILPRADYVCCHLALAVRLIPALPLGDSLYLVALPPPATARAPPATLQALWRLNVSKHEQRLLGWLQQQVPPGSCHLKCLQILKGLRDLSGRGLEQPFGAQWSRVLSSYVLKTALFSLLLRHPWHTWQEQFLAERLEDLVLFLRDCLRKRVLMHFFLGNNGLPEALALPRLLREAAPVNLLAAFDGPTLDLAACQLLNAWTQAPKVIRMFSGPRRARGRVGRCQSLEGRTEKDEKEDVGRHVVEKM